ncbi:hypothetical protein SAMN04487996_112215 [Dyadobacter soli]|uniref:Uncharacterized protein n=1 Tax=Dyadobacter soli TaxID=659014 RepID=A0A1G7NZG4_9BACT|nr:hypothetical protein [Dyadobacter soli]SDF79458.1 hypothetical protein SAMN04487996_112215 [Dyadobacter soli]
MKARVADQHDTAASWLTAEKLEELRPIIEANAQAIVDKEVAAWTPEFRAALRKLREGGIENRS